MTQMERINQMSNLEQLTKMQVAPDASAKYAPLRVKNKSNFADGLDAPGEDEME
jgi:hypothetical protein